MFILVASDYARDDNAIANQFTEEDNCFSNNNGLRAWIGESKVTGYHLHWYYCKETQHDMAVAFWKSHPEMHKFPIKTVSWEYLTHKDEWNDQFHCVDPIASEHDSVGISDKELYRFLTSRIDGKSLVQSDSFYHDGHSWTFRDSDLSLSTLAQLAFRISFFSVEAKHNASRIARTILNGKTVILVE